MPYISMTTSKTLRAEQNTALKSAMGEAIALIPGKDESKLMISISGGSAMYFRGEEKPCAYVEVKLFGPSPSADKERFAAEACRIIEAEAGIPASDVFLTFHEMNEWCSGGKLNSR